MVKLVSGTSGAVAGAPEVLLTRHCAKRVAGSNQPWYAKVQLIAVNTMG